MKRISLIILGIFIMLSSVIFGCPEKEVHDGVENFIRNGFASVTSGKLIIYGDKVRELIKYQSGGNKEKENEIALYLTAGFYMYSNSHNLTLETK